MLQKIKWFLLIATFSTPLVGFALTAVDNYYELVIRLSGLFNVSLYVIMSFSVLFIAYEAFLYIVAGADVTKRAEAKGGIIYGVIALFVMISIWGIVTILIATVFSGPSYYTAPDKTEFDLLSII